MASQTLAIMYADIFPATAAAPSRAGSGQQPAGPERLPGPVFAHFDGHAVHTRGNAFLVSFVSPADAVLCGLVLQEVLRQHAANAPPDLRCTARVAIEVGEAEPCEDDVLGEAATVATRMGAIAGAGEVWLSEAVRVAAGLPDLQFTDMGERQFAGIAAPRRVHRASHAPDSAAARRFARGVRLTAHGVLLSGIREATADSRLRRKVVIGALLALLVLAGLSALLLRAPAGERAAGRVMAQLQRGEAAAALETAEAALQADPANRELVRLALKAADRELERMAAAGDYAGALRWLDARLQEHAYLEPLAARRLPLDARLAVAGAVAMPGGDASHPPPLVAFLARHPAEPAAPWIAAQLLGERGAPATRLWLQQEALERGLRPDDAIFRANVQWQEQGMADAQLLAASRALLLRWYPRQTRGWAAAVIEQGAVQAFVDAWPVLEQAGDARLAQPYYRALLDVATATGVEALEPALAILGAEVDPAHRAQVLALLADRAAGLARRADAVAAQTVITAARARFAADWGLQ